MTLIETRRFEVRVYAAWRLSWLKDEAGFGIFAGPFVLLWWRIWL